MTRMFLSKLCREHLTLKMIKKTMLSKLKPRQDIIKLMKLDCPEMIVLMMNLE